MIQQTIIDTIAKFTIDSITTKIYYVETEKIVESSNWIAEDGPFYIALIALIATLIFSYLGYRQSKRSLLISKENLVESKRIEKLRNTPLINFGKIPYKVAKIANNGTGVAVNVKVLYIYKNTSARSIQSLYSKMFRTANKSFGACSQIGGLHMIVGSEKVLFKITNPTTHLKSFLNDTIIKIEYEDIFKEKFSYETKF